MPKTTLLNDQCRKSNCNASQPYIHDVFDEITEMATGTHVNIVLFSSKNSSHEFAALLSQASTLTYHGCVHIAPVNV